MKLLRGLGMIVVLLVSVTATAGEGAAGDTTTVVQLELWELILLLLAFFSCVGAFGYFLFGIFNKGLDQRFVAQEELAKQRDRHLDERFGQLEDQMSQTTNRVRDLERDLPLRYVQREDWIRFSGTIDKKLDDLHTKFEDWTLKLSRKGRSK